MYVNGSWLRRSLLVAGLLAVACAHAATAPAGESDPPALPLSDAGFSLRLPEAEKVAFRGVVNLDTAGGPGAQMLYPGVAGVPGLLIGIFIHGALVEAGKQGEKTKLQQAADQVLEPYSAVIESFTNKELMQSGLSGLRGAGANQLIGPAEVGTGWVVESLPILSMTQDRSALVLENAIAIYAADDPKTVRYRNVVKVVSNARDDPDLLALWSADEGKQLKAVSAELYSHSLALVLQAVANAHGEASVQRTFRYFEGKEPKVERAQLVHEACGRAVVKTLRGWLMSIPLRPAAETSNLRECGDAGNQ